MKDARSTPPKPLLAELRTVVINVTIVLGVITFWLVLASRLLDDSIIIDQFEVTETVSTKGIERTLATRWFADHIDALARDARSPFELVAPVRVVTLPRDFEITQTGVSFRTLVDNLRYRLRDSTRISGEVTADDSAVIVVVRVSGAAARSFRQAVGPDGFAQASQLALRAAAEYCLETLSPYSAAVYHFQRGEADDGNTLKAIGSTLRARSATHVALAYNLWGLLERRKGNLSFAEAKFRQALTADPRLSEAITNLGLLEETRGSQEQALQQYVRAVQVDHGSLPAYVNGGRLLCELNRCQEGLRWLLRARRIDDKHPLVHLNLALAYQALGDTARAEASYNASITSAPTLPLPLVALANAYNDAAQTLLTQFLNGSKKLDAQSEAEFETTLSQADELYQRALTFEARSAEATNGLGDGWFRRATLSGSIGRDSDRTDDYLRKAEHHYSEAARCKEDWFIPYFNLGNVAFVRNQLGTAATFYDQATRLNPQYRDAWCQLSAVNRRLGNTEAEQAAREKCDAPQ